MSLTLEAKIISKLHPELDHLNESLLKDSLEKSLKKLGIKKLYGLVLHREKFLDLWDKGLYKVLFEFQSYSPY